MNKLLTIKSVCFALGSALLLLVSCKDKLTPTPHSNSTLPLENYTYLLYDSVVGEQSTQHYSLNRKINIQYDPNVDKCYMKDINQVNLPIDTFDRSELWKRGYVNRKDFHHRIIFNGDTLTIHHSVPVQIGSTNFKYTRGIKQ